MLSFILCPHMQAGDIFNMKLGDTPLYQRALYALSALKQSGAEGEHLKAIAEYLLHSHDSSVAESVFPYVGDRSDPRDRAIVEAYEASWESFIQGDDYDEISSVVM